MVSKEEYMDYMALEVAPSDFSRLEYLSLNTLKSIMTRNVPNKDSFYYKDFKSALMEQINFYDENRDLIINESSDGYTLGSYTEQKSEKNETNNSLKRISPMAYEILLNCGFLEMTLGGCCYD